VKPTASVQLRAAALRRSMGTTDGVEWRARDVAGNLGGLTHEL
jgi:hypothetical protein